MIVAIAAGLFTGSNFSAAMPLSNFPFFNKTNLLGGAPLSDFEIPAKHNLGISQKLARSHPSKMKGGLL